MSARDDADARQRRIWLALSFIGKHLERQDSESRGRSPPPVRRERGTLTPPVRRDRERSGSSPSAASGERGRSSSPVHRERGAAPSLVRGGSEWRASGASASKAREQASPFATGARGRASSLGTAGTTGRDRSRSRRSPTDGEGRRGAHPATRPPESLQDALAMCVEKAASGADLRFDKLEVLRPPHGRSMFRWAWRNCRTLNMDRLLETMQARDIEDKTIFHATSAGALCHILRDSFLRAGGTRVGSTGFRAAVLARETLEDAVYSNYYAGVVIEACAVGVFQKYSTAGRDLALQDDEDWRVAVLRQPGLGKLR